MEDSNILLGEILRFDSLREKYADRRIKLRFNKNWYWSDEDGSCGWFDYVQEYRDSRGVEDSEFYKSIYSTYSDKTKRMQSNEIVFQFIEIGWNQWLFVDVRVIIDADGCIHDNGWIFAKAEYLTGYEPFLGRLIVGKPKDRGFYYVSNEIVDSIPVWEVTPQTFLEQSETFGGYEKVCMSYKELKYVMQMSEWWSALSNVYGVYVIADRATGKKYVGSAYGENGVAGRWNEYLNSGYDNDEKETGEYPNKKLKVLVKEKGLSYIQTNFQYALLEIFPKNETGRKKALERESYWKEILLTRGEFGYNDN